MFTFTKYQKARRAKSRRKIIMGKQVGENLSKQGIPFIRVWANYLEPECLLSHNKK